MSTSISDLIRVDRRQDGVVVEIGGNSIAMRVYLSAVATRVLVDQLLEALPEAKKKS